MRNLPQTVKSFKLNINDHCSEGDSPYHTVYSRDWQMNDQKSLPTNYRGVARRSCSSLADDNRLNKLNQLCCYLAKHRTRLLLTSISLVFLSIFLVVIYRQFGWIAFISLVGIVSIPFILIFIYAKRIESKEDEQQQQQQISRNHRIDRRQRNDQTNESTMTTLKNPSIFHTKIEMENIANEQSNNSSSALKRNDLRKPTNLHFAHHHHHHHNHNHNRNNNQQRQKSIVIQLPKTEITQQS